jgi:N6-adenosine-specific RNA methylase IME4
MSKIDLFAREQTEGWTGWGYDLGTDLGPWGVRPLEKEVTCG